MSGLTGQAPNHNVFHHNLSNILDISGAGSSKVASAFAALIPLLPGDALARPISPGNLGMYEHASIHSDGSPVPGHIVAPWEVVFVPNPALAIPANSTNDFRVDVSSVVKSGDVIYTVVARRSENSTEFEHVGEIVADSEFIASEYGDRRLHFRHSSAQWRH